MKGGLETMLESAATQVTKYGLHCTASEWYTVNKGGNVTGSALIYEVLYEAQVQWAVIHEMPFKSQFPDQYSLWWAFAWRSERSEMTRSNHWKCSTGLSWRLP